LIPASGRVLGFDLGSVRIGVALSDTHQRVASARDVVVRGRDAGADRRGLARLVAEEEAVGVIVGLPLSLDGSVGPAARAILDEVAVLEPVLGVPVETVDERFTTVAAHQSLRAGGRRGPKARQGVDSIAAALLLQSWLERRISAQEATP
jgi:putative Holliday junction resolvase